MVMLGGNFPRCTHLRHPAAAARRKDHRQSERDRAIADIDDMIVLLDDALLASWAGAGELAEEMVEIDDLNPRRRSPIRRSDGALHRLSSRQRWERAPHAWRPPCAAARGGQSG